MTDKYTQDEEITVREYLLRKGFKESQIKLHTIFINNKKASLDDKIKKDDKVVVLPILKGGESLHN